ncbi:MAG TPA: guanylate kinase [Terriglobia bacterium]|nr:guanylate kinase [Terriglobia bacterium]
MTEPRSHKKRSPEGSIIVVSAPSGAGKSTLVKRLLHSLPDLCFSVSHTTRQPRPGEQNGREYFFVDRAEFMRMVARKEFVEWADVFGHLYGTSRRQLRKAQEAGQDVLLDIDVQGHRQVRRQLPEAVSIFLLPPSFEELKRRLLRRHSDAPGVIRRRLDKARKEIGHWREYDYLIVNDVLALAARALQGVVVAARFRRERQGAQTQEILKTFVGGKK